MKKCMCGLPAPMSSTGRACRATQFQLAWSMCCLQKLNAMPEASVVMRVTLSVPQRMLWLFLQSLPLPAQPLPLPLLTLSILPGENVHGRLAPLLPPFLISPMLIDTSKHNVFIADLLQCLHHRQLAAQPRDASCGKHLECHSSQQQCAQ